MRELANDTTRSAIETHAKNSGFDKVVAKMIAAAAGLVAAGLASVYWADQPMLKLLGVGGGLAAAAFWTWQAILVKRRLPMPVRKVTPATIGAASQAAADQASEPVADLGTSEA